MASRIITDISDFIFVEDTPEPADAIFLPGGTHAEQPEYAAALYRQGYGKWLVPPPCTARDTGSGLSLPGASA